MRQYDLLSNCIEIGLKKGIGFFDKYTLWLLNYAAVSNISQFGGRYREEPILCWKPLPAPLQGTPEFNGPILCLKQRQLLPGKKIVAERIREDRKPYYAALQRGRSMGAGPLRRLTASRLFEWSSQTPTLGAVALWLLRSHSPPGLCLPSGSRQPVSPTRGHPET